MKKKDQLYKLLIALIFVLTLGLAPFVPEPHLLGKLRWVIGGGEGMQALDYFDLFLHASPWVYLAFTIFKFLQADHSQ